MIAKTLYVAATLMASSSVASADTLALKQDVNLPMREVGVLDFAIGMKADDAAKLVDGLVEAEALERNDSYMNAISMQRFQSEPFPAAVKASRGKPSFPDEELFLGFTSPSSGNQLYFIKRNVRLFSDNPKIEDVAAALVAKYGDPTKRDTARGDLNLTWVLGTSSKCPNQCRLWNNEVGLNAPIYTPSDWVIQSGDTGADVVITAHIGAYYQEKDRASSIDVSIIDLKLRSETAKSDLAQFEAAISESSKREVAVPKL